MRNLKNSWKSLFREALKLLKKERVPLEDWSFGGGTALHVVWNLPRISKDIDIFFQDVQLLTRFSPRLNDMAEEIASKGYVEQSNFVKLLLPEGEIDFIVAPFLTKSPLKIWHCVVDNQEISVRAETPPEIIAKKFFYRSLSFTVRDVVDLVLSLHRFEKDFESDFWKLVASKAKEIEHRWKIVEDDFDRIFLEKLQFNEEATFEEKDPKFYRQTFHTFLQKLRL